MYKKFMIGLIFTIGLGTGFGNTYLIENYSPSRSDNTYINKISMKINGFVGKNNDASKTLLQKLSKFMFEFAPINDKLTQQKYYIIHKITDHLLIQQKQDKHQLASERANLAAEAQNFQLAYELTKDIPLDADLSEARWAAIIQFAQIQEGPEAYENIQKKYQPIYDKFKDGNLTNFIFWLRDESYDVNIAQMQENAAAKQQLQDLLPFLYIYLGKHHYDFFHAEEDMTSEQLKAIFHDEIVLNHLMSMEYLAEDENDFIILKDLGTFYQRLGFFEKAQGAFEKAAMIHPTYATYSSLATSLLWTSCNEERSRELYSRAAAMFEGDDNHKYTYDISRWTDICGNVDSRNDYMKKNKERREFLDKVYYTLFD